ncbi:MAG: flagellar basal-body MS-ring/collar protein FliF [Blastocatellia bacterium]
MNNFFSQIKNFWQSLSIIQKISLPSVLIGTLAIIGLLVFYSSEPEYSVLFTSLKPSDAQKVVEKLKSSQVSYKLSDYGTTISVPNAQVLEMRLQVAGSGILSGGHVGFDIFDKNSFGATDFSQQVNYQRALEGELARTLESMYEIKSARVHITKMRESVFVDKVEPSKASVMIDLATTRISPERTEAIVSLVSSAVEGLTPENIIVTDTQGRLLAGGRNSQNINSLNALDKLMETRRSLELDISERVVSLLEPITGEGRVKSNVIAEIDFNQVEETQEKYDPKSAVVRAQQLAQEIKSSPILPLGVAGVRANDPITTPTPTPDPTAVNSNGRSANTTTYEIDKTTKKIIGTGGQLTKISVSVLVDEQTTKGKRTPEELEKIQELVVAAVGINTTRGDQVAVQMIPFNQTTAVNIPSTWLEKNRDLVKIGIKYGAIFLVSLLLILMVIRPAIQTFKPASPAIAEQTLLPAATVTEVSLVEGNKEISNKEAKLLKDNNDKIQENENNENNEIESLIIDKPRTVAELVAAVDQTEGKSKEDKPKDDLSQIPNVETELNAIRMQIISYSKKDPAKVAMTIRSWLRK